MATYNLGVVHRRLDVRTLWLRTAFVCLAVCAGASRASGQNTASVCNITSTERVVAVGDVHGAYTNFVAILRAAGVLDNRDRWIGGRTILIQTGDILDRGDDSRRVVDLMRRLERDAQRAGGRVLSLLGNHELMRVLGDWRYVSPGELRAFRRTDSEELREQVYANVAAGAKERATAAKMPFDDRAFREQFMKEVPLGFIEMRQAFDGGEYGMWVKARPTMAIVNGIAYMHGGVSEKAAPMGCDGINSAVSKELAGLPVPPERIPDLLAAAEDGPLWYRGLAQEPEDTFAPALAKVLEQVRARGFVIGHTPVLPGRVATRFGGRVVQIDGGMLGGEFFPKGAPVALEVRGTEMTAIYLDRRERVETPALAASAPASR
jgi:hypothetical protein